MKTVKTAAAYKTFLARWFKNSDVIHVYENQELLATFPGATLRLSAHDDDLGRWLIDMVDAGYLEERTA